MSLQFGYFIGLKLISTSTLISLAFFQEHLIGLRGVFLTHFIHSDASHLFNNSIPLFVLIK